MTRQSVLATRAPFHLEATARVLQRRPSNLVDIWELGRYLRVLTLPEGLALVEVQNRGTIDNPDVQFSIRAGDTSSATYKDARQMLRKMLGLNMDPAPLHRLFWAERSLRTVDSALRGLRPPRFADLFEAFASVVPFQQLSLEAGIAILSRLVMRLGQTLDHAGRRFHAFPSAQSFANTPLEALRACGLSMKKAQTLRGVALAIESGDLSERELAALSTQEALERLKQLPGVGPWSAGLVLLRGLGRLDVFPSGDVGAARGLRALMQLTSVAPLEPVIERFGPYRGHLYFYALGGWLLTKGLIHPAPKSAHSKWAAREGTRTPN